jgi:hypothetical protein
MRAIWGIDGIKSESHIAKSRRLVPRAPRELHLGVVCRVDLRAANDVSRLDHWRAALVDSFRMTSEFMK